jgi:hypothetical protein
MDHQAYLIDLTNTFWAGFRTGHWAATLFGQQVGAGIGAGRGRSRPVRAGLKWLERAYFRIGSLRCSLDIEQTGYLID